MTDNSLGNNFTILTDRHARLNEVGCPYGEVRLTLAIRCFRIGAYLFHQTEYFHLCLYWCLSSLKGRNKKEKKLKLAWELFIWKVMAIRAKQKFWAECCSWNQELWTFRAVFKYLFYKTLPLLGHDAILERGIHEAVNIIFCLNCGLLFLPLFVIKQSNAHSAGGRMRNKQLGGSQTPQHCFGV